MLILQEFTRRTGSGENLNNGQRQGGIPPPYMSLYYTHMAIISEDNIQTFLILQPMKCTLQQETRIVTYEGERERVTSADDSLRVSAGVQKYRITVYSTKGTTSSGSPLWKEAQRELRQHQFITAYIAAYTVYRYCTRVMQYTRLV